MRRGKGEQVAHTIPTPPQIQQGSTGQIVKNAQGLLLAHGNDPKGIDGNFGPNTEAATEAFQQAENLAVDGIIGPNTWTALVTQ
jgi:peptidoglycan hydrolase-like protein with peptidoglycan-binding domain